MTEAIALDVHTHLIPIVEERLQGFDGIAWDPTRQVLTVDGHAVGIKPLFQPAALLDWMEKNGVAHAYVSAPPPVYRQHLRGADARRWADYINNGLRDIAEHSSGRLTALVHLPTEEPAVAAAIVAEWRTAGHRHFAMPAGTGDQRTLGLAEFEPLWKALDIAGAFVFFHPGECADGRLQSFYLANLVGNPYESTVAIAHLVLSGVLERHPAITPCFAHGGGLTPMVAGRLQRGYDTARPGVATDLQPPEAVYGRIFVDCICHSEAAAVAAEATFGQDRVVFGSDWPFPMGLVEPHAQLASFEPQRRKRYFTTNANGLAGRIGT